MNPVLTRSAPYPFTHLDKKKAELRAQGRRIHDFTIGDPLEPTPPFIRDALISAIPEVSQYPTVAGRPSLRQTVARYVERRFDVSLDPDSEVIPCAGAKEAVFHLPLALVDRDSDKRTVVYGEPGYPVYERGTAYAGGEAYAASLKAERNFLLEPEDIPEEVLSRTCLFWINYPHNPTGAVADKAYFERVVAASKRHGFVVASDETYADLWTGSPPPSLLEVSRDNVLVIHSLSKRSGMTGYRSGFIAGDARLIAALKKQRPSIGVASQDFVQAAAEAAWSDDEHVAERRRIFNGKRSRVLRLCSDLGLRPLESATGLYVWIEAPNGDSVAYCERLLEEGVVVTPGAAFGPSGEGWFRIALVPPLDEIDEALDAWRVAHNRG